VKKAASAIGVEVISSIRAFTTWLLNYTNHPPSKTIKCQVEKPKAGNQPKQYTMPDKYSKCWQKD